MGAGGITFALIVAGELIALFRLMLPDMLRFGQARHDAVYCVTDSDCRPALLLNQIHVPGDTL